MVKEFYKRSRLKNALIIILLVYCASFIKAQNPYIHHFTTADGIPSNTVYQIFQDSKKFIWFSTDAGVVKFDGTTFKCYRKKDGLSSNDIVTIKEDSYGRIWFSNYNAATNYYLNGKIYNSKNSKFLKKLMGKGFFINFYVNDDQEICFYNYQREVFHLTVDNCVSKYNLLEKATTLPLAWNSRESVRIAYIEQTTLNDLRIFTSYGIYIQTKQDNRIINIDTSLNILGVYPTRNECYYLKTSNRGIIYATKNLVNKVISLPFNYLKVKDVLEDNNGILWVTTSDEGVYCFNKDKILRHFDINDALYVFQDHESNIWISTQSDGVYVINYDILNQTHIEKNTFSGSGIYNLSNSNSKGIWCTSINKVYYIKNNNVSVFDICKPDAAISHIHEFKNNKLLVGNKLGKVTIYDSIYFVKKKTIIKYKNIKKYSYYFKKLLINNCDTQIAIYDQNRLLRSNIIDLFEGLKLSCLSERINFAYYDLDDNIIVNGRKNFIVKNDTLIKHHLLDRFDGNLIINHLSIDKLSEIFNIDGDSIYLLKDYLFYNLSSSFNLNIDAQIKKVIYGNSMLFLCTNTNVFFCENVLNIIKHQNLILQPLNIQFNNINDILLKKDTLYVASEDGLTIISISSIFKSKSCAPIPYIQSVTINNILSPLYDHTIIIVGKQTLKLLCRSINFSFSPIIYSYILQGYDDEWTTGTGSNISIVYQNLPKGNYLFKLRMKRLNSLWSPPIEIKINIKPTFWEYPIVWFGSGLLLILIVFLVALRVRNQLNKRTEMNLQLIILDQKALQSMMNPHFIFNSLGSIQNYLLKNKIDNALTYLSHFSRLIRQNLKAINLAMIGLDDEIARLRSYLELEQIRMENSFDLFIHVDENLENNSVFIPSMIIQPFAENAVWHGISNIPSKGYIGIILIRINDNTLKVIIEDNGVGIANSEKIKVRPDAHLNIAMNLTKKRLALISKKYNINAQLTYSSMFPAQKHCGTRIEVILPYTHTSSIL